MGATELRGSVEIACAVKNHACVRLVSVVAARKAVQHFFSAREGAGDQHKDKSERESYREFPRHRLDLLMMRRREVGEVWRATTLPDELYTDLRQFIDLVRLDTLGFPFVIPVVRCKDVI